MLAEHRLAAAIAGKRRRDGQGGEVARAMSPSGWALVARLGSALCAPLARAYRRWRATEELRGLDERMLKDIGITRCEVERLVRYGRTYDSAGD